MKKLIEVSLPLEAINKESAREKSIRHGHPSTLHLWWARRPLAACRAVLFASLVDDPSGYMPDEESARQERERLFALIEELVKWENSNNEDVLDKARLEIARSVARTLNVDPPIGKEAVRELLATKAPPVLDPFAGGGSIPLEAQRLGLRACASDLNPVAVLINKALIEIPPRFAGMPPVHPTAAPTPSPSPTWGEGGDPTPGPSPMKGEGLLRLEVPPELHRKMIEIARQFRKEPTPSEAILWQALRGKKLDGVKFRRQQPIGPFVVDFFAPAVRLVVEVDGPIHETQREADRQRQQLLEATGLKILRLTAHEVENNLPASLQKIREAILKHRTPPSPPVGEGGRGDEGTQLPLFQREWKGAQGLAEDVRYYGQWMRDEAQKRIGHLYPPVKAIRKPDGSYRHATPEEIVNRQSSIENLTVIAWLWARTVKCPNPACGAQMPLISSFELSKKKGKQAWVEPLVDHTSRPPRITFNVKTGVGAPPPPPKVGRGAQFRCLACGQIAAEESIRAEFKAKRNGAQMMAIVAEGKHGRVYLPPNDEHIRIAKSAVPAWISEEEMNTETPNLVSGRGYGITHWHELFTPRQLTALTTFSDLVGEARQRVLEDARAVFPHPQPFPHEGGRETLPSPMLGEGPGVGASPQAYADAVATYLAFGLDRLADRSSTVCSWDTGYTKIRNTFSRQAIPMIWDYAEGNLFSDSTGNWMAMVDWVWKVLETLPATSATGQASQTDAQRLSLPISTIISTDPPYYDNIGYADLSDFFYVWLRRALGKTYPDLFPTLLVPKAQELVATPYRFGGDKRRAEQFFEDGLRRTFQNLRRSAAPDFPLTVYYAFKQFEEEGDDETEDQPGLPNGRASTGWETMLEGLLASGFEITGTWPMRTELANRSVGLGTNALASSIVLVCRPRPEKALSCSRREFVSALKKELAPALHELQQGSIAPVDLAQAAIGPGMAVFSRYKAVLEADGRPMSVRTALALINQALDEYLTEQEGEYDADTRWALAWFEQFGHNEAPFGVAETLSKAKNTSVEGLAEAGILEARGGKVRLLRRDELTPLPFDRGGAGGGVSTAWEAVQRLIHALDTSGESAAADLLATLGALADPARDLAYRLYTVCERKGWAQEALGYNMLVVAWPRLKDLAARQTGKQERLL